ncbi:MAG TPA: FecR domain-containing protein [Solimonas sp.]
MSAPAIAPQVLDQAAEWLMRLHSGSATEAERQAFEQWRGAHPEHERAWQLSEHFLQGLHRVHSSVAHAALRRPPSASRRRALRQMLLLAAALPPVWWTVQRQPWATWSADYRTATGERRQVRLADGTLLELNTASAADVRYDAAQRLVRLRAGEVLVTTGRDAAQRPFFVETGFGRAQAIGTRFSVREHPEYSEVAVYEGLVDLVPADQGQAVLRLRAGERSRFTRQQAALPTAAREAETLWVRGMLVADDWRLDRLLSELGRYRSGHLRCDPAVAALRISGAFPLDDIPRSLELIQDVLPVRIDGPERYWTVIAPRG